MATAANIHQIAPTGARELMPDLVDVGIRCERFTEPVNHGFRATSAIKRSVSAASSLSFIRERLKLNRVFFEKITHRV